MFVAVVVFILIFSLLVLAHEWGHYYSAKRVGIKVEEFGLGLPPRMAGIKRGETIYSINWIPFGGFVKYTEGDESSTNKRAFINKSIWQRALVVVAGVLMNFFVAFVVLMIGFWASMPPLVTAPEQYVEDPTKINSKVIVLEIEEASPAEMAQLQLGDYIIGSGDVRFNSVDDFKVFLENKANQAVSFTVERSGEEVVLSITPKLNDEGNVVVGVWIDRAIEKVNYIWWKVPWLALQETVRLTGIIAVAIANFVFRLFTTASIPAELAGPVGIAKITADLLHLGWLKILQFMVFLSLNLAIINLVPFPALDGGRLLFIIIEALRGGRKLPQRIEGAIHSVGFMLLLLLLLVVTFRDIFKLI